ncbi:MAG: TolC family protein [Phycisphaerae bacterium]|nr:TolC family protein [Phycisphaerae bacterium]
MVSRSAPVVALVSVSLTAFLFLGCATVQPQQDFQRAAQLITERTGVEDVYDPDAEELIEAKLDELLAGGLTVDEAVRAALLNNRSFQSMFQTIGASRADVVQSGLLTNPSVSLLAQFPEGGGRSKIEIGFGQELVDLWQIPVRRKIANAQLDQAVLDVTRHAVDLAADVKIKCYQFLAARRAEETGRKSVELFERSLELANRRFEAGEVGQVDVDLIRSEVMQVKLQLLSLERERRLAAAALARVLGLSRAGKPWALEDSLPEPQALSDDSTLLTTAMTRRIDARLAESRVRGAEEELTLEVLKVLPSLDVGALLERPDNRALPGRKVLADTARASLRNGRLTAPDIQTRAERNLERRQIIDSLLGPSITFTLPIWDQNQAQIAKARFNVLQKRKDYEDLLDTVAHEVQQSAAIARIAGAQVRYYAEQVLPLAEKNVETAKRLYEAGEQGILVVIESQELLIQQRRLYEEAIRDCAVAIAELERAVGGRPDTPPRAEPVGPSASVMLPEGQ